MSGTKSPQGGISRRSFLKTTGAVVGAAGLAGASTALPALAEVEGTQANDDTTVYSGSCRGNCFQGCHIYYKVREGRVVETEAGKFPDGQYDRICPKGHSLPHRFYDEHRTQYPLRRVEGTERGAGQWERISWDEALSDIAEKWKGYLDELGGRSLGFVSISGNSGIANGTVYTRLMNVLGATKLALHVDNALFKGTIDTLGRAVAWNSNDMSDMINTRCLFVWGSNTTESQIQMWHFMAEAIDAGAKMVCIDPNITGVASKSDVHVRLRPGTDSALAMGMMNVVLEKGWEDLDFLSKHTVAPFLVKEDGKYLRAADIGMQVDGIEEDDVAAKTIMVARSDSEFDIVGNVENPLLEGTFTVNGIKATTAYSLLLDAIRDYTPDKVAEICDIPVEQIYEITDLYCNHGPSWIFQGLGQEHYVNGHYSYISTASLAMLTGNLAKPGASCGYVRPRNPYKTGTAGKPKGSKGSLTVAAELLPEIVETDKYGEYDIPLRSIWVFNNNWFGVTTERKTFIDAFNKVDLIIVADPCMTETAQYADYVLPVCDWAENLDVHGNATLYPCIHLQEKAIEPLFESKSDYDIICELAKKLGIEQYFSQTTEEFLEECMGTDVWNELLEKKCIWQDYFVDDGYTYIHGADGVYPTATTRAQFYLENPGRGFYGEVQYGQTVDWAKERLPHWEPPNEAWHENELFKKYPLTNYQEHIKWRTHTQFGYVPLLRELDPEPVIKLNPEDAHERGIETGDIVRAFNDRGYVVLKAVIDAGLRKGMTNIPHGWQRDQFIEGHYNDLTSREMNPIVCNNNFNDVLIEVEKYEEA